MKYKSPIYVEPNTIIFIYFKNYFDGGPSNFRMSKKTYFQPAFVIDHNLEYLLLFKIIIKKIQNSVISLKCRRGFFTSTSFSKE